MTLLDYLKCAFWTAATFAMLSVGFLVNDAAVTMRQVGTASAEVQSTVAEARLKLLCRKQPTCLPDLVNNANAVLIQAGIAADQAAQASIEQRILLRQNSEQLKASLTELTAVLVQVRQSTATTTAETADTMEHLRGAIDRLGAAAEAMDKLASDPHNQQTLTELHGVMVEAHGLMANANAATADVQAVTAHYRKTLTAPVGTFKTIMGILFDPAWKVIMAARGR